MRSGKKKEEENRKWKNGRMEKGNEITLYLILASRLPKMAESGISYILQAAISTPKSTLTKGACVMLYHDRYRMEVFIFNYGTEEVTSLYCSSVEKMILP